ncbi:hypothetical protein OY671_007178 [Metschnikowia pulcherrima]|nr:hypothetical protein OY671_007178 [Metschnikowia pulcherrima]
MKIQFALLASVFLSSVAAAPSYNKMDSVKVARAESTKNEFFKRSESTSYEEIGKLHRALREAVKTTEYNSKAAQNVLRDFPSRIVEAERMVKTRSPEGAFGGELKHFKNLFQAFKEAAEAANRFEKSEYPGAEIVQKAMNLRVKALEMNELQGGFYEPTSEYLKNIKEIKSQIESLGNDAKTKGMAPEMQKMFSAQSEKVKKAIQTLEDDETFRLSLGS